MKKIEFVEIIAGEDGFFNYPSGICYDLKQDVFYIADMHNHRICWLHRTSREKGELPNAITGFDGGSQLKRPLAVSLSGKGDLYVADAENNGIFCKKMDSDDWNPVVRSYRDESEPLLNLPGGVTVDYQENVYTNDFLNNRIRGIDKAGRVFTLAGHDGMISQPYGVFHKQDKIYFTDTGNGCIRYFDLYTRQTLTLQPQKSVKAKMAPIAVTVDDEGNVYICEQRAMLYYDIGTRELLSVLDRDIWRGLSQKFSLKDKICHIGSVVVPEKGEIYWTDTIKGLIYRMVVSN